MKTHFISVNAKQEPDYSKINEEVNRKIVEKKLAIYYSNQFIEVANTLSKKVNKEIVSKMQVLGCSNPKFVPEVEAILIIGQGKFHSVSLAYESKLPTYILENGKITKISSEEIEKMEKQEKGAFLKYLHSETVGILVSTKPGQQQLKKATEFKKNLKEKKSYVFISNDLNTSEFENFGIDCWINSACPRMDLNDSRIINLNKIPK
jgi:2-(3-amino-3-carboxypropyl)histidine synthase